MPEIVATRSLRRRVPLASDWSGVAWQDASPARTGASPWRILAIAGGAVVLAGIGAYRQLVTESVSLAQEAPVWIEMPPEPAEVIAPPPAPPTSEARSEPVHASLPPPLQASSDAAPAQDPAFGLDDAVATGGLAVATGTTLAKEPDPVVRPPEPAPGPVALSSVPASVRPVVPVYPPRAEERGLEARVVALVTTDTSGNVVHVGIERSGGRDFDASVRRAILATRFTLPRGNDGRARAATFRMPYDFRLQ